MSRYLLLFIALLLTGCASNPRGAAFSPAAATGKDLATVYVYRLHTPPILRKPDIEINGKSVAALPTNSYTVVHLQPGSYDFKTSWGFMDGNMMNTGKRLRLAANTTYYIEVINDAGFIGTVGIYRSALAVQTLTEPPAAIRDCSLVQAAALTDRR